MKDESKQPDDLQRLWQAQPAPPVEVDMERIHADAKAFETSVRARDGREKRFAWPLAAFFAAVAIWSFVAGNSMSGLGATIVSGSMLWIVHVLRRFGPRLDHQDALGRDGSSFLLAYRGELDRQRRLLSFAWLWYCLPILVGLGLFHFGIAAEKGQSFGEWALSVTSVATVGVIIAIALLNLAAARGLTRQLDELGTVTPED